MTGDNATVTSPFWTFSLRLYADPEVARVSVELQDCQGADINVLLFMLWAASCGRRLSIGEVGDIVASVESWRTSVVVPLRTARRSLRSPPALIDAKFAAALRLQVKKVELEAERLQEEALYRLRAIDELGRPEPSLDAAATANVKAYSGVLAKEFGAAAIETLLAALQRQQTPGASA
jgi:uncharacterized protein (TIGR02444 family)